MVGCTSSRDTPSQQHPDAWCYVAGSSFLLGLTIGPPFPRASRHLCNLRHPSCLSPLRVQDALLLSQPPIHVEYHVALSNNMTLAVHNIHTLSKNGSSRCISNISWPGVAGTVGIQRDHTPNGNGSTEGLPDDTSSLHPVALDHLLCICLNHGMDAILFLRGNAAPINLRVIIVL